MLLPVAQYAFFFWLVVGNNNGEVLRARHMEQVDQNTYRIAACTIRCMQQQSYNQQQQQQQQSAQPSYLQPLQQQQLSQLQQKLEKSHFEHCFEYCHNASAASKHQDNLRKIYENLSLNLICRDDSSLTFRIDTQLRRAEETESSSNHSDITTKHTGTQAALPLTATKGTTTLAANKNHTVETIYFVKIHVDKDADNYDVYLSDDNFFTLKQLQENATHSLSVVAVHANNEYSVISKEQQYNTLRRGYTPGMVTDIQVREFSADETSEMHLLAKVTWKPAADMTCHYDIICFSPEGSEYVLTPLEIRNNLTFSSSYKVGIRAINSNNGAKESALFWRNFEAPSCMEWFNNNFNICAPLRPSGLEVEQIFVGESAFALNISWQQPEHLPDYYIVRVLDLDVNGSTSVYNVSKQSTGLYIPNVTLHGIMYEVHLTAYTHGGNATALITDMVKSVVVVPDENHVVKLIAAILAPIFCIVILSLTIFIICHRRAKLKRYQERCKYFEELEKKAPIDPKAAFDFTTKTLPRLTSPEDLTQFQLDLEEKILFDDAMEIDRKDLTLLEVLGEGAFGLVRRGVYSDNKFGPRQIAVKMLKDQPSADDERAFRREIEVMKSVEKHPNIVGLIGHCTKRNSEMMLLTEYCSFGNLQDFLRDEWKYLYELNLQCKAKAAAPRLPARMHTSGATRNAVQQLSSSGSGSISNNNNNAKNISLFNIDVRLIEKLKLKYKSLSANQLQANSSSSNKNGTTSIIHIEDLVGTTTTTTAAADNKSYGYDETCTNACKCQVNVLIRNLDGSAASAEAEQLECVLQQKAQHATCSTSANTSATTTTTAAAAAKTIEVQNCECRQLLSLARKNRRNAAAAATTATALKLSVENRAYYKYMAVENAQQHHQQQQRQRQLQDSGNTGDSTETCFKRVPLSAGDLLDIAKQVAVGMEFLAKNKVVHRDLAARNVLVAADRTVKIADFGLSRDIYQENIYKKTGNGKLPIKWLALESMTHQVYTTQSDVWSYGILLYEIVTLGGTPYPSIATNRLLHLLKTGYRMEKPKNCGQDFYNLMHSCWHVNPGERPNFTGIINNLDNLLSDAPQQQISNVLSVPKAQIVKVASSDDSYLKPLK